MLSSKENIFDFQDNSENIKDQKPWFNQEEVFFFHLSTH